MEMVIINYSPRAVAIMQATVVGMFQKRLKDLTGIPAESHAKAIDSELQKTDLFEGFPGQGATPGWVTASPDTDPAVVERIARELNGFGYGAFHKADSVLKSLGAGVVLNTIQTDATVAVESVGDDLFVDVYRRQAGDISRASLKLEGGAADPRLDAVTHQLWKDISERGIDLKFENEKKILQTKAREFLESGRGEVEETVILSDGKEYPYFLDRQTVGALYGEATSRMQTRVADFLAQNGVTDRTRAAVLLVGEAMGNEYLETSLTPGFAAVQKLDTNLLNAIALKIAGIDSVVQPEPVQPVPQPAAPHPAAPQAPSRQPASPKPEPAPTPSPEAPKTESQTSATPRINITAKVESVKAGLFKTKKTLKIRIDSPTLRKLKWASVLCIQENPLVQISQQTVVKEYSRGEDLPFLLDVDLPLAWAPKARKLRVYFKPSPGEPVGINAAYQGGYVQVDV